MQKHNDAMKTSRTQVFRKICLSLHWKGLCVRGSWRTVTELATYWPPTLMAITAFLSCSPGLLNRGPGGPASLGHCPPASSLQLIRGSELQLLNRGYWGPPLLGAGSLYHILSPTNLNFKSLGLYNNLTPTLRPASVTISHSIQPLGGQGYILIFLDWDAPVIYAGAFPYFDSLAGVGGQYTTKPKPMRM